MKFRKVLAFSTAAVTLPLAAPALAQQPSLHVGATVTDPQGGMVGTITAIDGATLILHTDRLDARLPVTSFTATANGVLFGMTQAQLDAAVEAAQAANAQALRVGAVLHDNMGAVVGPITVLDAETATVQIGTNVVRVPRGGIQVNNGNLVINTTLAQLRAASVPAPPPAPPAPPASPTAAH
jgi:hypothetical protein